MSTLLQISEELLCYTLRYFNIREIIKSNFGFICKEFYSAVNNPACYSIISCHDWKMTPYHDFYCQLFKSKRHYPTFRNVKHLVFDMCDITTFDDQIMLQLLEYAPNIIQSMKKLEWLCFADWNGVLWD
eukprot:323140_1